MDTFPFQIVRFLPSNKTAPRVDCAFLVSVTGRAHLASARKPVGTTLLVSSKNISLVSLIIQITNCTNCCFKQFYYRG